MLDVPNTDFTWNTVCYRLIVHVRQKTDCMLRCICIKLNKSRASAPLFTEDILVSKWITRMTSKLKRDQFSVASVILLAAGKLLQKPLRHEIVTAAKKVESILCMFLHCPFLEVSHMTMMKCAWCSIVRVEANVSCMWSNPCRCMRVWPLTLMIWVVMTNALSLMIIIRWCLTMKQ